MTPFGLTQCPPPEGCRWSESDDNVWTLRDWEGDRHLAVIIKDLSSDDSDRWSVAAENFEVEARIRLITTLADLPSAYRRALQAVGLAPDLEKAALQTEAEALRARVADLEGYLLAPEPETHQRSPDDAPHTDDPFWLPDDL